MIRRTLLALAGALGAAAALAQAPAEPARLNQVDRRPRSRARCRTI
jgi:hypothetical protein